MEHRLWTFLVRGGEAFTVQPPGNPANHHDGSMSLFHLTLTEDQKQQVEDAATERGATVEVREVEGETEEQQAERRALLGQGREDAVWPSSECPKCFWFDILTDDPCGIRAWPPETIQAALNHHLKAQDDMIECPVGGTVGDEEVVDDPWI